MSFGLALVLCALALAQPAGPADAPPPAPAPLLVFRGNLALVDEIYTNLLSLPPSSQATPALAAEVEARLLRFLRDSGYDLARVRARAGQGQITVDIDEGRVERVVLVGSNAVGSLLFRLQVVLPFTVFNRPLLDRELAALREQYGLRSLRWELAATAARDQPLPVEGLEKLRADALALAERNSLLSPPTGRELRVFIESGERGGLSPVVAIGEGGNGVEGGAAWKGLDLLFPNDRFEVEARLGGDRRDRLDGGGSELFLSHAGLRLRWFTPAFGALPRLRAFLEVAGDLIDRQRQDLALESFHFASAAASLNLAAALPLSIGLRLGAGFARRWLWGLDPATISTPLLPQVDATPRAQSAWFLTAGGEVVLEPEEVRKHRKHRLDAKVTLFGLRGQGSAVQGAIDADYRRVFSFGSTELWVQARARLIFGDVPFPDERQVSDVTRGPFGGIWVRQVAGPRSELRLSLLRDVVQFGVYDDAAVFGALDRTTGNASTQLADVAGIAVHALLFDSLQLDLYFGAGLTTQGKGDTGLALELREAF